MLAAAPALARPGGWGQSRWGESSSDRDPAPPARAARDRSREGRVEVARFVGEGDAARRLGHGTIAVRSASPGDSWVGPVDRATFEAAIIDGLVHAGYQTDTPGGSAAQTVELRVLREVVEPAEVKRSPVSGETEVAVSNRGTAYGMALSVDLTKPLPALVSTRLEARIRDTATGQVLWEGRAEVATREGKDGWTDAKIATRLSEALFDGFPLMTDRLSAGG